jgi:hypothetical protein
MKTYKSIFAIMFVLALILPAMPVDAKRARSAAILLTAPSPNPVSVGSEITFDLFLSVTDINPGVAGIDIYLKYNPALVEPRPGAVLATVLPDFFGPLFSNPVNANVQTCPGGSNPVGDGPCIHLVIAGTPQSARSALTARFYFRAIAQGPAEFLVLQSTLVDADGFPVTHVGAASKWVTIESRAAVTGIVQRQGILPNAGKLACSQVIAINAGNQIFGPAYTDRNGSFTLPNLPDGNYTLRADYSGYLQSDKQITITVNNPPVIDFSTTTLLGGDVNNSNEINILDIAAIAAPSVFGSVGVAVGSTLPNCSVVDNPYDINDDGQVNISDLAIAAGNWNKSGSTPWQP